MTPATTSLRSAVGARLPRLTAALALPLLLVLGCHDSPSEPRGDISFQNVAKATLSPRSGPQIRTVVRDQASWEAVWRELWGDSAPARPQVDFRREMVIVATASLSCFGVVEIEDVDSGRGELEIRIADAVSEPFCLCVAPEYAFHVVRASRVDAPASFAVRVVRSRCG